MTPLLLVALAFAAMEPVTAWTHRFVMHGVGARLHRSHHRRTQRASWWEANDVFPLAFAGIVCAGLWIGFNSAAWSELIPVGIGVTLYGLGYALVHDVYIHRRLRWFGDRRPRWLERLADAHGLHHRFGGAPYGMLLPIVPSRVRSRAARAGERVVALPGP